MAQSEAQLEELRCEVEKRQALEARIRATVRVLSVGQLLRTAQYGISSMVVHRAREITPGGLKGDRARTPWATVCLLTHLHTIYTSLSEYSVRLPTRPRTSVEPPG